MRSRRTDVINYKGQRFSGYNKPKRTPGEAKKFAVLAKEGDQVRLVRFGDPNMSIKKHIPERRASFRARHGCDNPGTKLSAEYWSCAAWGIAILGAFVMINECRQSNLDRGGLFRAHARHVELQKT
jgi:hypothetical protein